MALWMTMPAIVVVAAILADPRRDEDLDPPHFGEAHSLA